MAGEELQLGRVEIAVLEVAVVVRENVYACCRRPGLQAAGR